MTAYVFDIEANGLQPTEIFCLVAMDTETGKTYEYGPDKIKEGIKLLQKANKLIGHNILGYDIPVIKNLTGVDLDDGIFRHVQNVGILLVDAVAFRLHIDELPAVVVRHFIEGRFFDCAQSLR